MKLVIDTSILIDKLRSGTKWDEFLSTVNSNAKLYLPSIVIFELFSGLSSRKVGIAKKISDMRKYFNEVDLTPEIAKRAGEMNRDIIGNLDLPDYIIAAAAMEIGAQVVTLNKKHFQKIPGISLYEGNWE